MGMIDCKSLALEKRYSGMMLSTTVVGRLVERNLN